MSAHERTTIIVYKGIQPMWDDHNEAMLEELKVHKREAIEYKANRISTAFKDVGVPIAMSEAVKLAHVTTVLKELFEDIA